MGLCIGNFSASVIPSSVKTAAGTSHQKYGVKFDGVNSAGIRTYAAAKFAWTPSTNTVAGADSFKGIPMFTPKECITKYNSATGKQEVICYKGDEAFDTMKANKDGNVMMEFTKFYYYRPSETEWILTPDYTFGFKPAPAFYRDGKLIDKIYVSKYNVGPGFVSQTGVSTLTNTNMNTFRNGLKAVGMYMWDMPLWETIKMLCFVKYANCDVQACNSMGYNSGSRTYTSGNADNVKGLDGSATAVSSNEACLCFGIENLYGNCWKYLDGIFSYDYYMYLKEVSQVSADPTSFNDLASYTKCNSPVPSMSESEIKTLCFDTDFDYLTIPKSVGDGPYNDCGWSASGLKIILVGGNAWNGAMVGLLTFSCNNAVGSAGVYLGSGAMWY